MGELNFAYIDGNSRFELPIPGRMIQTLSMSETFGSRR